MKVSEIMTKNPITVQADDPVRDAAGLLRTHRIGGLPVMEGDRLAGIVTESDIIALLDTGAFQMISGFPPARSHRGSGQGVHQLGEDQGGPDQHWG